MPLSGRTDLAAEARLQHGRSQDVGQLSGVRAAEETLEGLAVARVEILDAEGARALGLPIGRYDTLRLPPVYPPRGEEFQKLVRVLSCLIRRCLPSPLPSSVLIAALGNPDVTPDALGPLCAESVLVTRHLRNEPAFTALRPVALCRTGVLGTTGLESAFQIQSLCRSLSPGCVLAVDALAGSDPEALCRCVQISDAGIAPGSGVGNDRAALNAGTLRVPVVAIGVPTVIDAASLSGEESFGKLFVTPRYIDSSVRQLARLIGFAINAALQEGLSLEDMELLLG